MRLKGTEIVEKKNLLNEIRHNSMTLQELRFFSIYLSKINARDEATRKVRFKLEDFQKIMNIEKITIQHFKNTTNRLLGKVVNVPNEDGSKGFTAFQIFKKCKVYEDKNDNNQWYVEIDAHDDALPLMFNLKKNYFKYEIWNALRLKSRNQLHMYELLKQYEMLGVREIPLDQLKDWLGLTEGEYARWNNFRAKVLNECQAALKKYTDICFEYEPIKTGRRVTGVRFLIATNKGYEDPIKLSDFIDSIEVCSDDNLKRTKTVKLSNSKDKKEFEDICSSENEYTNEFIEFLAGACMYEFSEVKMIVIKDLLFRMGYCKDNNELETYEYLLDKYHELNSKENIPRDAKERRYGLLKWLIKNDLKKEKTMDS